MPLFGANTFGPLEKLLVGLQGDNKYYFEEVDKKLQNRAISSDFQMIIGDFNTTLDYSLDRKGYSKTIHTHKNCRALIVDRK